MDYPGGSVWKTVDEAAHYIAVIGLGDFSVWEIDADWDADTYDGPHGYRDLLHDRRIVREIGCTEPEEG